MNQTDILPVSNNKYIIMQDDTNTLNFKYEFVRLAEFLLNLINLIQNNGGSMQMIPLKQVLDEKKVEVQQKYIVATTIPKKLEQINKQHESNFKTIST